MLDLRTPSQMNRDCRVDIRMEGGLPKTAAVPASYGQHGESGAITKPGKFCARCQCRLLTVYLLYFFFSTHVLNKQINERH